MAGVAISVIEFSLNSPWQDNWPVWVQLWADSSRLPGTELDLSADSRTVPLADPEAEPDNPTQITVPRNLTAQFRDKGGTVVLAYAELLPGEPDPETGDPVWVANPDWADHVAIATPEARGVVKITPSGDAWQALGKDAQYTLEVIAYGYLYAAVPYSTKMPEPGIERLNGVEIYGSPRQVLELLGPVPGVVAEITVDLGHAWVLDERGYWKAAIASDQQLYGLWIDDRHAKKVGYPELALAGERAWARVVEPGAAAGEPPSHWLYYKGPEDLSQTFNETAASIYVYRCLKEATAEAERRTGRIFAKHRVLREVHRGLGRMRQIMPRHSPVWLDQFFRLDALSYRRDLYRRYTEADFSPQTTYASSGQVLHLDSPTGVITLNQNIWDWWSAGNDGMTSDFGLGGFAFLPRGEANIEISYTAGFDVTPPDVDEAVANLAAVRQGIYWNQALSAGMTSLSIGCVNLNFSELMGRWFPAWTQSADQILQAYTNLEIEGI